MLEVFFQSTKEVISFCEQLFYYNKKIELHWRTHDEWGNQLILKDDFLTEGAHEILAKSMVDVFIDHRLNPMMKEVVTKKYYYTDVNEIERILDIAHWLVTGKDEDCQAVRGDEDLTSLLFSLFKMNVQDVHNTIHFDSIINFRLNLFKEQLIYFVGLAIDEYKREEDHQAFINMLRDYIINKHPVYHTVHVLQGDTFLFFKENGKQFSRHELADVMQHEPLYMVGLDENEWNLSPLIAMTPERIYVYGDHPSEPKTLTVINIFQERVIFKSSHQFPFTHLSRRL